MLRTPDGGGTRKSPNVFLSLLCDRLPLPDVHSCAHFVRQQIEDDLTDYEEDVERDTFNTYRLYIRLHGPKRAPEALAAWISRLESQLHSLQQASPSRVRSCRVAYIFDIHLS